MDISVISLQDVAQAERLMREIGVDPGGIEIMAPKSVTRLVMVRRLPIFAANILKQETLSLGADTAVSRQALTGKAAHTDCLIIGSLSHYRRLCEKLRRQPYGLSRLSLDLETVLSNYQKNDFILDLGRYKLNLQSHTHIMGIINLTPDSFSGDGLYKSQKSKVKSQNLRALHNRHLVIARSGSDEAISDGDCFAPSRLAMTARGFSGGLNLNNIVDYARKLVDEGADILDIGGESSRPGARPVPLKEELLRVIPAIKAIGKKLKIPLSVDTSKSEVARQALDNGALIVNDITALNGDPGMLRIVKRYKAAVALMHMKGRPHTMQKNPRYGCFMREVCGYLKQAMDKALEAGVDRKRIILDPGIGLGKSLEHNLEIIKSLGRLKALGQPILIGLSRKSFLGKITGKETVSRVFAGISANCLAVINGARIVRVHDVQETRDSLKVLDRILKCQ